MKLKLYIIKKSYLEGILYEINKTKIAKTVKTIKSRSGALSVLKARRFLPPASNTLPLDGPRVVGVILVQI